MTTTMAMLMMVTTTTTTMMMTMMVVAPVEARLAKRDVVGGVGGRDEHYEYYVGER